MYIRNLRKLSPNKNVFKFASAKASETIMCESTLEFDALDLLTSKFPASTVPASLC